MNMQFFGLNYRNSWHMSKVRKNQGHKYEKNCICPKYENDGDIIMNFLVYIQMTENSDTF